MSARTTAKPAAKPVNRNAQARQALKAEQAAKVPAVDPTRDKRGRRTTTVTHPDGSTSSRTSGSMTYTHAIVRTQDGTYAAVAWSTSPQLAQRAADRYARHGKPGATYSVVECQVAPVKVGAPTAPAKRAARAATGVKAAPAPKATPKPKVAPKATPKPARQRPKGIRPGKPDVARAQLLLAALRKSGARGLSLAEQDAIITDRQGPGRASRARALVVATLAKRGEVLVGVRDGGVYRHRVSKSSTTEVA